MIVVFEIVVVVVVFVNILAVAEVSLSIVLFFDELAVVLAVLPVLFGPIAAVARLVEVVVVAVNFAIVVIVDDFPSVPVFVGIDQN